MAKTSHVYCEDEFFSTLAEALTDFKCNSLKAEQIEWATMRNNFGSVLQMFLLFFENNIQEMLECLQKRPILSAVKQLLSVNSFVCVCKLK